MHLEKVTSRSSEAALAGWISSNDVTLFTTVLVLAVAIYLHSRADQGKKESRRLAAANTTLATSLEATAAERDTSSSLLSETRAALAETQRELDELRRQQAEKLSNISQLNARLDALLREKGELESQRKSLVETSQTLTTARDSLQSEKSELAKQLQTVTAQLTEKVSALEQAAAERDRLTKQADELGAIVAGLKARVGALDLDLTSTKAAAADASAKSQSQVQALETQLAERGKLGDEYLAKLKQATEALEGLQLEKLKLQQSISEAESKRQAELVEEGRHNRALLGLTGRLERVAILFDASGSMKRAGASGGDRWAESQQIAATWLEHLNVQQCVLIVYSSKVWTFPEDGKLADLRGAAGQAKRSELLGRVRGVTPAGTTNTLEALRKAYEYELDAILLFSDGAPSESDSGRFDPVVAEQIYDLCRSHAKIPVHTIGLGNYFDANASSFLRTVASTTGGTFRGE